MLPSVSGIMFVCWGVVLFLNRRHLKVAKEHTFTVHHYVLHLLPVRSSANGFDPLFSCCRAIGPFEFCFRSMRDFNPRDHSLLIVWCCTLAILT